MQHGAQKVIEKMKARIAELDTSVITKTRGIVTHVADGIIRISGLPDCQVNEVLIFDDGSRALALNLESDTIGAVILDSVSQITEGSGVHRSGTLLSLSVSDALIGRVVNPLGITIDGGDAVEAKAQYPIERVAPGVLTREPVGTPLATGITAIDAMIPIGRGQRELIIGDRQTGKTAIAIDTILNQKGKDIICIYVAIGQKQSKIARTYARLKEAGALEYTIVVSASASDPAAINYLAPYSGVTIGEYFMDQGKDVLVVYDDLTRHAHAYRELSLLLRRPPGREAYPGDVFYLHSRLLERACRLNEAHGGGSITALPIIETQGGDVSAYIPTNVISITDGQIFLESGLFNKGVRPAINVGISVSRVGSAAQTKPIKKVSGKLKLAMAQYRELESFAQFDSDLDPETKKLLHRGKRLVELLKQKQYKPLSVGFQVASIFSANEGYLDPVSLNEIQEWQEGLHRFLSIQHKAIVDDIEKGQWDDRMETALRVAIDAYVGSRI